MQAYSAELESKPNGLTEQVRLSRVRRFGVFSETAGQEVPEQMSLLFNEAEFHADEAAKAEKTVVQEHERKKRSGSVRDVVPKNITVEEVRHELARSLSLTLKSGNNGVPEMNAVKRIFPGEYVSGASTFVGVRSAHISGILRAAASSSAISA